MQSPINVEMKRVHLIKSDASELQINYGDSALHLKNNGHTIQVDVIGDATVIFKGNEYRLVQFHFHTPSEHMINHQSYPMEMHLVNQDKDGRLLVLGIMIKEGEGNQAIASLWNHLPATQGKEVALDKNTAPNVATLLPSASHHLFYNGSLTTPPCTEGVQWVLFEQSIGLSKSQIHQFRKLFSDNHRPAQPVNEREVDED